MAHTLDGAMKTKTIHLAVRLVLGLCVLLSCACSTVPITGRRQMLLIPHDQNIAMSFQNYHQVMAQNRFSSNRADVEMVNRVGTRLQRAVETYFGDHQMSDRLKGFQWEFNLFENKEVNAWCMPGGKVAVYTGLLPVTQNETALAIVLGHEIAHAVAEHGNEKLSKALLIAVGAAGIEIALRNKTPETRTLWMAAYGLGSTVGLVLPFSREQESEADRLGLIFAAMAGYDPHEAVAFWQRMASSGKSPPEFLNDHPSNARRIKDINAELSEAMRYYKPLP